MIEITPRPYQSRDIPRIKDAFKRVKRVLYVSCCGSGKTVVFSKIAQGITLKGNSAVLIAHRKELITQCSDKLNRFNVVHGIIKTGFIPDYTLPVQVASVQTLHKRLTEIDPDMLIYDEAHHSQAKQAQEVIAAYPDAILLGVTASPVFGNGKTLSGFYDEMIIGATVKELVDEGYLVETRVFAPPLVADLEGADYDDINDLEQRMNKRRVTGSAIDHYRRLTDGWPAIAYCTTIKHADDVAAQFREAGYSFYRIDGEMHPTVRDKLLTDFAEGRIQGLASCDLIGEGTDVPRARVGIKLAPTNSLGKHIQNDGRLNRPVYAAGMPQDTADQRKASIADGDKPYSIVLDHVDNWLFHGLPDDEYEWSLTAAPVRKTLGGTSVPIQQCQKCDRVFPPAECCPHCGHRPEIKERRLKMTKGQLKQITAAENVERKRLAAELKAQKAREKEQKKIDKSAAAARAAEIRKRTNAARSLDALQALGRELGYDPRWASLKFKTRRR